MHPRATGRQGSNSHSTAICPRNGNRDMANLKPQPTLLPQQLNPIVTSVDGSNPYLQAEGSEDCYPHTAIIAGKWTDSKHKAQIEERSALRGPIVSGNLNRAKSLLTLHWQPGKISPRRAMSIRPFCLHTTQNQPPGCAGNSKAAARRYEEMFDD